MCGDLELEGYVLNPSASSYDALRLAGEYSAAVSVENGDENDCAAASLRRLFAAMDKKIEETDSSCCFMTSSFRSRMCSLQWSRRASPLTATESRNSANSSARG